MKKEYRNKMGYFTTGEFAELCNVKKQTLFHYDNIGVLRPEVTEDNGYRYYSYSQLESFATIAMLRGLGMPLAKIKDYLGNRSPQAFIGLLEGQLQQIDTKMAELMWLRTFVERRQRLTREGMDVSHGEIYREVRPEEHYITTRHEGGIGDRDIYKAVVRHQKNCRQNRIYSPNGIGGLVHIDTKFIDREDYLYSHVYTRFDPIDIDTEEDGGSFDTAIICGDVTIMESGEYLCICSTMGYDPVPALYKKLLGYISTNNVKTGEYFFEEALLDDMSRFNFSQHTIKISIPIKIK